MTSRRERDAIATQLGDLARALDIDPGALAASLRKSLGLAGSPSNDAHPAPDAIADVLARVVTMRGSVRGAVNWFIDQPLAGFGNLRPVDVLRTEGTLPLSAWLDAVESGANA